MSKFFVEISLAERRCVATLGFESASIRSVDVSGAMRQVLETDRFSIWCYGRFYDHSTLADIQRWLVQFDAAAIGSWLTQRDGDFWVVIYDRERNEVNVLSDRNGQLRLYYALDNHRVYVANSIMQLATRLPSPRLSNWGVFSFLNLRYLLDPGTTLEGVSSSLPGTYAVLNSAGQRLERYYAPVNVDAEYFRTMADCVSGLDQAFESTFRKRLEPSQPGLVMLSGGIDSVAMLRYLSKVAPGRIRTFTLGLSTERDGDEMKAARMAADHFRVPHEVYWLKTDEVADHVADAFVDVDGPFYNYALWLMVRDALPQVFDGQQLFTGQDTRLHTPTFDFPKQLGIWGSQLPLRWQEVLRASLNATRVWPFRGKRTFAYWRQAGAPHESVQAYLLESLIGFRGDKDSQWAEALRHEVPQLTAQPSLQELFKQFITFDYRTQFTDDMYSFISVIETERTKVHFPFYDHDVVATCNRIPYHLGAKQVFTLHSWSWVPFTQKAVLRRLLLRDVPIGLVYRRKSTLPSIHQAFNGRLRGLITLILTRWQGDLREVLDDDNRRTVDSLVEQFSSTQAFDLYAHHDLLWFTYGIAYLTVLNQVCRGNQGIIDEIRELATQV